jgi:hypothetical protein
MNVAVNLFAFAVIDGLVIEPKRFEGTVARKLIRHDRCAALGGFANVGHERACAHIRGCLGNNLSAASENANHRSLARRATSTFALANPADVSFIGFHRSAKPLLRTHGDVHQLPDLMVDAPRGFIGHPGLPHQFHCRYTVAAGGHQEHGVEPRFEGRGGLVENRSGSGRNLVPAPSTGILASGCHGVKAAGFAAFLARSAVWKPLVEKVLQAVGIRLELHVEVPNRIFIFHAQNLP